MDFPPILYPLYLETAKPFVLPRTEAERIHAELEHIYAITFAHVNSDLAKQHPCVMALTSTKGLKPLLVQHWKSIGLDAENVHPECLVLSLSPSLDGTAASLAGQWPDVFNAPHLNLLSNTTFLGWRTHLPGESTLTSIQVPIHLKLDRAFDSACGPETAGWHWMPMVVVDGGTVAIGGFVVDLNLSNAVHSGYMSRGHHPLEVYSEAELAAAAKKAEIHGPQPWLYQRWWDGKHWIVEAPLMGFDFPAKQGHRRATNFLASDGQR